MCGRPNKEDRWSAGVQEELHAMPMLARVAHADRLSDVLPGLP